jgi:hypothetical protein
MGIQYALILGVALILLWTGAADAQPVKWRVAQTRYPTPDVVVAGCSVLEFGAKGDGVTDNTGAFKAALARLVERAAARSLGKGSGKRKRVGKRVGKGSVLGFK